MQAPLLLESGDWGIIPQVASIKAGAPGVCAISLREMLVLSLECTGGGRWQKCPLAPPQKVEDHSQLEMWENQKPDSQAAACKVCNQIPSKETQGDGHSAFPLCADPWVIVMTSAHVPIKNSLRFPQARKSYGCKPLWLSELGVRGSYLLSGSLKRPQGKVEVSGSFRIVWHCAHGGLSGESMSHTFLHVYVHIFSIAQICRSHPASFCISLSSVYSCMFSTSMGGEKFRNLLCHHLGLFQSENSNSTYPIELFREFF